MSRCHSVEKLKLSTRVYGITRAAIRFSVIVARTDCLAGVPLSGSRESTGVDVETFPEPSGAHVRACRTAAVWHPGRAPR